MAKEYYFRLRSGEIVLISTNDDISLHEAINSGDFESSFINHHDNPDEIIETQADSNNLLSMISSLQDDASNYQCSLFKSDNLIEIINICHEPVPCETHYRNKCAMPGCMRRFKSSATGGHSKRSEHHKTHFKPEYLEALEGKPVTCPFCFGKMAGTLRNIIVHYILYCSARNN